MSDVIGVRWIQELEELPYRIQLEGAVYGQLGTALLIKSAGLLVKREEGAAGSALARQRYP